MTDLDMYNAYVSRDVLDKLYKNSYRGYVPAFNQFVNHIDKLTMADIEQENALRVHAHLISILITKMAENAAENAALNAEIVAVNVKIDRLTGFINKQFPDVGM